MYLFNSMLGGMGAAANAAPDTTNEFHLFRGGTSPPTSGFHCQLVFVVPFHISMGLFLTCVGSLLCSIMVWRAVGKSLTKIHKCLHYTFLFTLAVCFTVLSVGVFASFIATFGLIIATACVNLFPITQADHCNHVLYYWAFVEVVILLAVIGLGILVSTVSCIVFVFFCLLAWTGRE